MQRIIFKVATLVCLYRLAPAYLALRCVPVAPLIAGPTHLHFGVTCTGRLPFGLVRDLSVCSPAAVWNPLWNWLPDELRSSELSLSSFRKGLETFLFRCWLLSFLRL